MYGEKLGCPPVKFDRSRTTISQIRRVTNGFIARCYIPGEGEDELVFNCFADLKNWMASTWGIWEAVDQEAIDAFNREH